MEIPFLLSAPVLSHYAEASIPLCQSTRGGGRAPTIERQCDLPGYAMGPGIQSRCPVLPGSGQLELLSYVTTLEWIEEKVVPLIPFIYAMQRRLEEKVR